MARISLRSLKAWLPVNLILPTLTFGPSSTLKIRMTAFLEAIENIGFRNGVNIVVADAPDDRTFLNFKNNDLGVGAVRRFFHAQFYVLKELSIPKSLKITAQRLFVIDVVFAAENPGFQGVIAHPPVADKIDALDDLGPLLLLRCLWAVIRPWMTFVKNHFAGQQI